MKYPWIDFTMAFLGHYKEPFYKTIPGFSELNVALPNGMIYLLSTLTLATDLMEPGHASLADLP